MSISLVRSRPLDPLFLAEDGLASGSSVPSAAVVFGQSPESAMVNEIFNNPDAWNLHVPEQQREEIHSAGSVDPTSGNSLSGPSSSSSSSSRIGQQENQHATTSSTKKLKVSKGARHPEGYHLKRKSKLHAEAFTLKPFESRHLVIPYLSSASSASSLPSSTPSLNSSLPTISDEDSMDTHSKSLQLSQSRWRGIKEKDDVPSESLSLLALMEPSNNMSPAAEERMSILWSHQNIFRAFPTPKGGEYDVRKESPSSSSLPSSESTGANSRIAVNSALPLSAPVENERQVSPQTGVMKPRRNVPPLKISTTKTRTITRTTTIITVQSPEKSSPASLALISASTTWNILELYGDSPGPSPSPKGVAVPKTSGHINSSFKSSDLHFPSVPRLNPPKSAFASRFTDSTNSSKIVELPADFVIPKLPRTKSKVRGPRKVPHSPMRITLPKEVPPPLPEKDAPRVKDRKSGKVRPLPKVPRAHSPPPPVPAMSVSKRQAPPPMPPALPSTTSIAKVSTTPDSSPPPVPKKAVTSSSTSTSALSSRGKKLAIRSRMPPPPPLPLDSPLPPLPPKAVAAELDALKDQVADAKIGLEGVQEPQVPAVVETVTLKVPEVQIVPTAPVATSEKDVPVRPARQAGDSLLNLSPPVLPAMPEIVLPLPLPPARPSRKDVVSPLPSPTLRRMKALESLPLKSIVSPPSPGHKPSASESSIGFSGAGNTGITHTHAHTHLPHVPSSGSTMLSAKKSIRKSSSFSSLPRFVPPDVDVPLPDASVLAKRTRKSSAPGVRPPIEDFQIVVTRAPDVSAKTPLVPVFVSGSKGFGGGNREDAAALTTAALTAAESIPSATVSMRALVSDALQLEAELAQKEHVMKDSSVPLQPVEKVTFPSVESRPQSPAVSVVSRASPIPAHKKGASLNHTETRPVLKAHKKSSSSVSFRPPFVEAPLPDATTLAKRLVTRKDSTSNGFRPPFVDVMRRKGSVGQDSRPHISSTTSDTAVVSRRQHQKAEERPVVLHSTSDMVIPYRPPVVSAETSTSTSTSSLRPSGSSPSHSRSASSVSSSPAPAPVLDARRRNGSISVRRPVIDNVPLPDTSVLALRFRTGSSQSSRPSSDASDAFSPSPVSVDKITASSSPSTTSRTAQRVQIGSSQSNRPSSDASDASDAFSHSVVSVDKSIASSSPLASRTDSASSVNTEPAVPLPAPKPVAVGASWIPQLSSRLTQPERPPAWVQDPQSSEQAVRPLPPKGSAIPVLSAGQHSRSRSGSIARAARVTSPPSVPSLPSLPSVPSLPSAPSPSRNSPPLQPPPKLESVMRTPSPSILIRNKAASPVPPSMHVRFRSIDKHPVPPLVVPLVEPVSNINNGNAKSRPSLPEIPVRGRQPTITRKPTGGGSGVVSPRRSASVAAVSRHPTSKRRSASIAATPRNLPHVPPPPSLPLGSAESQSPSESIASAGLNRGRISPFPTRPISRTSVYTARVGA